jgi:3-hydroxybutyrate dehydrogenase
MKGQVAVVTGGAGGIGRAIAQRFAQEGAKVAVVDISLLGAQEAVGAIQAGGGSAMAVEMDVADEAMVEQGIRTVLDAWHRIDTLVTCAGYQHIALVEDLKLEDWKRMLAVHLDGAFLVTRACLRNMYKQEHGGAILYLGSVHAYEASPLKAPYVAAKHGLLGLARVVAKEGAHRRVRTNVLCPGPVRTRLVERQIPEQAEQLGITEEEVVHKVLLRGTLDGEFTALGDVAETAVFLATFPSNALSGQSILVSHGWHMQ